jgi:hypothetical protein
MLCLEAPDLRILISLDILLLLMLLESIDCPFRL